MHLKYLFGILASFLDSGIGSTDISFNDHDSHLDEEHNYHVEGELISVFEVLSTSGIQIGVVSDQEETYHELRECDPSIHILARFLLFYLWEEILEINNRGHILYKFLCFGAFFFFESFDFSYHFFIINNQR